jgi:hypothetical protein
MLPEVLRLWLEKIYRLNTLNKQPRTADKGWYSSFGVWQGGQKYLVVKIQIFTKCYTGPKYWAGFCDHGDETSYSIKGGKCLHYLNDSCFSRRSLLHGVSALVLGLILSIRDTGINWQNMYGRAPALICWSLCTLPALICWNLWYIACFDLLKFMIHCLLWFAEIYDTVPALICWSVWYIVCFDLLKFMIHCLRWFADIYDTLPALICWSLWYIACVDLLKFMIHCLLWFAEIYDTVPALICWNLWYSACVDLLKFMIHCLLWFAEIYDTLPAFICWCMWYIACFDLLKFMTHCLLWFADIYDTVPALICWYIWYGTCVEMLIFLGTFMDSLIRHHIDKNRPLDIFSGKSGVHPFFWRSIFKILYPFHPVRSFNGICVKCDFFYDSS